MAVAAHGSAGEHLPAAVPARTCTGRHPRHRVTPPARRRSRARQDDSGSSHRRRDPRTDAARARAHRGSCLTEGTVAVGAQRPISHRGMACRLRVSGAPRCRVGHHESLDVSRRHDYVDRLRQASRGHACARGIGMGRGGVRRGAWAHGALGPCACGGCAGSARANRRPPHSDAARRR